MDEKKLRELNDRELETIKGGTSVPAISMDLQNNISMPCPTAEKQKMKNSKCQVIPCPFVNKNTCPKFQRTPEWCRKKKTNNH